jgi:putative nucleotidyltransferase with HDIG domain
MSNFVHYLDLTTPLENRISAIFIELSLTKEQSEGINAFLHPLKVKDQATYDHCLRVGLLCKEVSNFMHLDQKALFYAGILHDVGKALTNTETLGRTDGWTTTDAEEIKAHVQDGWRLLRGCFDFSAEIISWHHQFQQNGYPETLPEPLHQYCNGTKTMISFYGRILALCDVYDALHRINAKFGALTGEAIKEKMFLYNPDQKVFLRNLYEANIFTTFTVSENT